MANVVNNELAYALADALMITVEAHTTGQKLRGETTVQLDVNGVKVPVTAKIIGGLINRTNHMALVKVQGNLLMLVIAAEAKPTTATHLLMLNLAKMGPLDNWLEHNQPTTPKAAEAMLGKAVVAKFFRTQGSVWAKAA